MHKKFYTNEVESIYEMGWKAHMAEDWDKAAYFYKLAAKCGNIKEMVEKSH